MTYVEKYINRADDFSIISMRDKSGRSALECCEEIFDESQDSEIETILEFLTDHDPGLDEEFEEDPENDEISGEVRKYEKSYSKEIDYELVCHVVKEIWTKPKQGGSILVFLPGFHEIRELGLVENKNSCVIKI